MHLKYICFQRVFRMKRNLNFTLIFHLVEGSIIATILFKKERRAK